MALGCEDRTVEGYVATIIGSIDHVPGIVQESCGVGKPGASGEIEEALVVDPGREAVFEAVVHMIIL